MKQNELRERLLSASAVISLFLLWEGLVRLGLLKAAMIPPPSVLPAAFARELAQGTLIPALCSSLSHYFIGSFGGGLLGIVFGSLAARSRLLFCLQAWLSALLRPIPPLAWIPFAIVWFGITTTAASFIIAIGVFWITYQASLSAVLAVDPRLPELSRAFGREGFWDTLFAIYLPACAPQILASLRSALGQGWMLVIAAELFGVSGVGQRMWDAAGLIATDIVLVYMVLIAVVYSVVDWCYMRVERRVLRWMPA